MTYIPANPDTYGISSDQERDKRKRFFAGWNPAKLFLILDADDRVVAEGAVFTTGPIVIYFNDGRELRVVGRIEDAIFSNESIIYIS